MPNEPVTEICRMDNGMSYIPSKCRVAILERGGCFLRLRCYFSLHRCGRAGVTEASFAAQRSYRIGGDLKSAVARAKRDMEAFVKRGAMSPGSMKDLQHTICIEL